MTTQLAPLAVQRFYDNSGVLAVGGSLYTYQAGTTTPQDTYTDSTGGTPNANPIVLNARGEAAIWIDPIQSYKFVLKDALGNTLWTSDNISSYVGLSNTIIASQGAGMVGFNYSLAYASGTIGKWLKDLATSTGATLIGFLQAGTGTVLRTLQSKLQDQKSVLDFGADNTGSAGASSAIQACINAAGHIWIPDGTYLIDADLVVPDNKIITFSKGATFNASANGRIFFKSTTSAYFSQIWNATLNGNGKAGVVGFDMTNMRLQAGLFNCACSGMDTGFIARAGCFGTQVLNFNTMIVPNPIKVLANASTLDILHPTLDNGATIGGTLVGIGIDIQSGSSSNLGVRVVGGYIQGFATGIQDAGIGTKVIDTYFETNTVADVSGNAARGSSYSGLQLFGPSGAAGVKLRNCDAITIFNPTMASGARTVLYDIDNTNTNCTEHRTVSNASYNSPTGALTYLGAIPTQTKDVFTPVVTGSGTAGIGTYSVQAGKWSRTGNVIHFDITVAWSAHSGTGNIGVTGLPAMLVPASFSPTRVFNLAVNGISFTGPVLYASFSGTGTSITLLQLSTAGGLSLIPIAASGTLNITGSYEL